MSEWITNLLPWNKDAEQATQPDPPHDKAALKVPLDLAWEAMGKKISEVAAWQSTTPEDEGGEVSAMSEMAKRLSHAVWATQEEDPVLKAIETDPRIVVRDSVVDIPLEQSAVSEMTIRLQALWSSQNEDPANTSDDPPLDSPSAVSEMARRLSHAVWATQDEDPDLKAVETDPRIVVRDSVVDLPLESPSAIDIARRVSHAVWEEVPGSKARPNGDNFTLHDAARRLSVAVGLAPEAQQFPELTFSERVTAAYEEKLHVIETAATARRQEIILVLTEFAELQTSIPSALDIIRDERQPIGIPQGFQQVLTEADAKAYFDVSLSS
ncbi:MAG: hypothetical protein KVP17_003848 [Porospora cf. gigantea B]|uniref:uncharacterized protein n=1 Tax=Porospora cf. gigantea B TaxID=2853592 RepID=UPI0035718F40|nr:MAG: hypothetical protein KVP17_003848 [Porospora cf. gigantea B]